MASQEPVTTAASEGYKLMSYNTSWVLDCHENQIDDNSYLSESAAIIAKMKLMNEKETYDELFEDDYKNKLNKFRMALADKATEYVKSKVDEKYDFIALIEQSMHLPATDHANYDPMMTNKFDLVTVTADNNTKTSKKDKVIQYNEKKENEEYGFLRRMKQLEIDKDNGNDTYNVAYDNGLNGANRAGEGIAILYNKSLVENKLEWDQKENPAWKFIQKNAGQEEGKLYKTIKYAEITQVNNNLENKPLVNFCSDDLGPTICYEDPNAESPKLVYSRKNGTSDEGRPIIITGGVVERGQILNLFIAAHGANIMNLCVYNASQADKQTNLVSKLENKDSLFAKLSGAITNFIKSAIESVSNKDILSDVVNVNIFLGGDFNDAKGFILRGLLENGIPLKVGNFDGTVNFHYDKLKSKNSNKENYPSIFSCCANCDSIIGGKDVGTLGPIIPSDSDDTKTLIARLGKYPPEFILQQNFANNGDYALFGSSYDKTEYDLILEQDDTSHAYVVGGKSVMASDHVPVISSIASSEETVSPVSSTEQQQTGGKRFRKRQTTYRKKHRSRSRRSTRRSSSSSSSFHSIRLGKGKTNKSLCLDVEGGSHGKGARFIAWPCHGGPNQKFRVMKTRKGRKCLQAKHSRHCLDEKTFQQVKCPK
jgi:hypothetical protein